MNNNLYTKIIKRGEFCSPQEVENVPNGNSYFLHESDLAHLDREHLKNQFKLTDEQLNNFENSVNNSADDVYMAIKTIKITVELLGN